MVVAEKHRAMYERCFQRKGIEYDDGAMRLGMHMSIGQKRWYSPNHNKNNNNTIKVISHGEMEIPPAIIRKLTDVSFHIAALPTIRDTPDWDSVLRACDLTIPELLLLKNIVLTQQQQGTNIISREHTLMSTYIVAAMNIYI